MVITASKCPTCGKESVWPKWNTKRRGDYGFPIVGFKCSKCGWYEEREMSPPGWPPYGTLAVSHERKRK